MDYEEDFVSESLNPFRAGRCLSTRVVALTNKAKESQSLSSRAMSFDVAYALRREGVQIVSIPFEQGDVFRRSGYYPF